MVSLAGYGGVKHDRLGPALVPSSLQLLALQDNIPPKILKALEKYVTKPEYQPDSVGSRASLRCDMV
eukprot:329808-Amphidinium_carterae.1